MTRLAGIDIHAPLMVVLPLFLAVLLLAAGLVSRGVSRLTARWFVGTDAPAVAGGVAAAVVLGGLLLVLPELDLPGRLAHWTSVAATVAFALACALIVSRIAVAAVTAWGERNPSVSPALGVARVAVRVVVGILAVIMALQAVGVPVAPLLTTLGVGSLAVALALQETLANFFAGLYLLADRPVRAGDYIKIHDGHDGEAGYVQAIGWRSSRLRTLKNNIVIVPNQKLSQAILTNFHLPAPPVAISVAVAISYDADPGAVEAALAEELARAAVEIAEIVEPGAAGDPGPDGGRPSLSVRLADLGESGMVFQCLFSVRDVEAQLTAGHELRKRILARLRRDGIEVAFPQRVVRHAHVGM
jgi:small-conductance mechanosensitive channel